MGNIASDGRPVHEIGHGYECDICGARAEIVLRRSSFEDRKDEAGWYRRSRLDAEAPEHPRCHRHCSVSAWHINGLEEPTLEER
jgi:hypothetical protein